jgi:hypothetical protein
LAADDSGGDLAQVVVELLQNPDRDVRALGLEQVRTEAKGAAATKQFAAQLPKLSVDAQVGLLSALADRGDMAARPAVVELLSSTREPAVRVGAIAALGPLGQADDTARLLPYLMSEAANEQKAARKSLINMRGDAASDAIATELKNAKPAACVLLLDVLTVRRASGTLKHVLPLAVNADPAVRGAAMKTLGELGGPDHLAGMIQGVLKAELGVERDAAERSVAQVCFRDVKGGAVDIEPLLEAFEENKGRGAELLPMFGRVGGKDVQQISEAAVADADPKNHAAGIRALCNWPDASLAPRLLELAQKDPHPEHRTMALMALIRVAPLPDKRPPAEKLGLLKQAMFLCTEDSQRNLVLKRASAIRDVETLRFLLPYVDQPTFSAQACESIVELAHHRNLREPNKAEFHKALDKVLQTSTDATVKDRATRYKNNQTWARPTKQE